MEEVLLEVSKRVNKLSDLVHLAATCSDLNNYTIKKEFWIKIYSYLESSIEDDRFLSWKLEYDWKHWRQYCFYLFNRQIVMIKENDIVKKTNRIEESEDQEKYNAKMMAFLESENKVPFVHNGEVFKLIFIISFLRYNSYSYSYSPYFFSSSLGLLLLESNVPFVHNGEVFLI